MTHVDELTARAYRDRTLDVDALLAVTSHLETCEQCRTALRSASAHARLIEAFTEEHLTYDQLVALVDDNTSHPHLTSCPSCRAELDDLRGTPAPPPAVPAAPRRRPFVTIAAIAALIVIAIALVPLLRHRTPTPIVAHEERVDVPARVLAMRRTNSTLMGEPVTTFDVVSPVATLVRETRPHFVWKPLAPNAKYRVEIYENGQRVAESPELTASEWQSDRDLQRGHDYVWQVIATHADTRAIAPRPPASEARFGIVDDAAFTRATRAESLDTLHRAAAFAREGLLDDARRAFANVDPRTADPRLLAAVRTALE